MKKNFLPTDNLFERNTLVYDAATGLAILVTTRRGRMSQKPMRVASVHAALRWAIAHHSVFLYLPSDPKRN
jgi:hypothetical protein